MAADLSLKYRVAATIFVVEAVMMALVLWPVLGELKDSVQRQLIAQEQVSLDLMAGLGRLALLTGEFAELQPQLENLRRDPRVSRALLADGKGRIVAASDASLLGRQASTIPSSTAGAWRSSDIVSATGRLGAVAIEFSNAPLLEAERKARTLGVVIAAIGVFLSAVVGVVIGWLLTRRIDVLSQAARRMAGGDLAVQTGLRGKDEIGQLGHSFDAMAARIAQEHAELAHLNEHLEAMVRQRTTALEQSNDQLREALDTVKRTQDELVRSEKLASLGSMVAGVAHELNTPIGSSLTVASTLADKTHDIIRDAEAGTLRRSQLQEFTTQTADAARLLVASLSQAGEMILHFKQLAVDQASAQRRRFEIADVVEDVLLAVRPAFKRTAHRIVSEIPRGLDCDSYPGPLGQALVNLINNALVHGFAGRDGGTLTLTAGAEGEHVRIEVADDGVGIPGEHQRHIFDPLFTTRLGQGRGGLGLHTVYGIVTRVLGGRIDFSSTPGVGTRFVIRLPRVAPQASDSENARELLP